MIGKVLCVAALILAVLALVGAKVFGLSDIQLLALGVGCLGVAALL